MKMPTQQWHCSLCPKSFGRKGDLTRHKLLHAGIKRHICNICNKAFSQYSGLKTHKNVHTKIKPFVCGFNSCSASFGDPSSCARHRKETHRRMGSYRCPFPMCKSSIKRRSAFVSHLKKHNIDVTYVDIDAMGTQFPPVAVNVQKRESVQEIKVIDAMPHTRFEPQRLVDQARQMYSDVNESSFCQFPHHQTSIPWTPYEDSGIMESESSSVLSTLLNFPISNSFNYDNIDVGPLLAMDSSSFISPSRPKSSFEATLLGEPLIKTEDEMMANVPRTFDGVLSSFNLKKSALTYPSSHLPNIYPGFKPSSYDFSVLPTLPWVQPT